MIYTIAQNYKKQLLNHEQSAIRDLIDSFKLLKDSLQNDYNELLKIIELALQNDETINQGWLFSQQRYQNLIIQIQNNLDIIQNQSQNHIINLQKIAIESGLNDSKHLINLQGVFNNFNPENVKKQLGFLSDGSPLEKLLNQINSQAFNSAKNILILSVGKGINPRMLAPLFSESLNISLVRALKIMRTETFRTYRQTSLDTYKNNDIKKYMWISKKSTKTCPACLSLDQKIFDIEVEQRNHQNCRCTIIPVVPDFKLNVKSGTEYFNDLNNDDKRKILGDKAFEIYQNNNLELNDFVALKHDKEWGSQYYTKSNKDLI